MIHPEAEFLPSCELMKPDRLCVSKIPQEDWDRRGTDSPIPSETRQGEERGYGSRGCPEPSKAGSFVSQGLEGHLIQVHVLPSGPGGASVSPSQLGKGGYCPKTLGASFWPCTLERWPQP